MSDFRLFFLWGGSGAGWGMLIGNLVKAFAE